ncbi:MAG: hypothetical protein HY959_07545 [Ignavibacteriae bacterium]|nr:hypothetical protein [Ignavibacteriota bacterium]
MDKTKILITVKTYPTLTTNYEESVCTAGITEEGNWIRICPIPYRSIDYSQQYKKYDWIEVEIEKNKSDFRPESFKLKSLDSEIRIIDHLNTDNNWEKRKQIVLKNVEYDLKKLINNAKDRKKLTSLSVFKPTKIIDFTFTSVSREWHSKKLKKLEQFNIFNNRGKVINKLPYKFLYIFEDINKKESKMMIEDWEIGALYWKGLEIKNSEKEALNYVKEKYFDYMIKKCDLCFFLGTTKLHHLTSKNPFLIIGIFYPLLDKKIQHVFPF